MRNIYIAIILLLFVNTLYGQEVNLYRVNIEGNTTTSDKMIKYSAGLRDGTQIQRSDISAAVTRLWDLGLFSDVNIVLNNDSEYGVEITIIVEESPTLNQVLFEGISARETRFTEKIDLKTGQRIRPSSLDAATKKIKEIYREDGYFDVEVESTIAVPQDTLVRTSYARDVVFSVIENEKYRLENITFKGNSHFSERKLKKELKETKERKWWSFWVKSFDEKTFEEDKTALALFYQNEGYRDFQVLSDTLIVDKENSSLTLELSIDEGEQYHYRQFTFEGNEIADEATLRQLLKIQEGDIYSEEDFTKSVYENMMSVYQDKGYIFSNVTPEIIPFGSDSLDINFVFTEGSKVYIENIFVSGNDKTRENVIRRELKLFPGDVFNRSKLMRSQRDIWILNYFDNVIPDVSPISDDRVNLDFVVQEKKSTQRINANLGFTGEYGITGGAGVEFDNFMGRGQKFNVGLSTGTNFSVYSNQEPSKYKSLNISFQDPMINDSPYLVGASIFYSYRGSSTNYYFPLDFTVAGAVTSFGRRLDWPDDFFRVMWSAKIMEKQYEGTQEDIDSYIGGLDKTRGLSFSQMLSRDSRNRAEFPTGGSRFQIENTYSGGILGGNENFQKHILDLQWFTPTFSKFILYNSFKLGVIKTLEVDDDVKSFVPFDERFIMGGNGIPYGNALRGYPDNSIGPQTASGQAVGGNSMGKVTTELRFPLSENPVIYVMAFGEMGNVWNSSKMSEPFYIDRNGPLSMKKSAGVGVRFFMPGIGKLGFDMGYGFDDINGDGNPQGWEYTITFGQTY
ncbi:MAG: outer membrane protein assembly factor BamA [Candidatus Marinimicrobia bacterium]|nr:outer membrane protein assembly factor BamA [Candidatus Neomarinimicrobiota bacterium]